MPVKSAVTAPSAPMVVFTSAPPVTVTGTVPTLVVAATPVLRQLPAGQVTAGEVVVGVGVGDTVPGAVVHPASPAAPTRSKAGINARLFMIILFRR